MKRLKTWGGRRYFEYEDSYESKIVIYYGTASKWKAIVPKEDYEKLIKEFAGKTVPIGTSIDKPDIGEKLGANAARLVREQYGWDCVAADFTKHCEELLSRGNSSTSIR